MQQLAPERVSEFIGSIYDCVIDPSRWQNVIGALCDELHFANGILSLQAMPSGDPLLLATEGLEPEWAASVLSYGPDILDAWGGSAHAGRLPLDEPLVMSHQTPRASWAQNRWYTDWLQPQGVFDAVTTVFVREPAMLGSLGFARASAAGEVSEAELSLLRLIGPHVRRTITISKLLDLKSVAVATFASVLDTLATGVVLVDAGLRPVHLNPVAQMLAKSGGPLMLARGRIRIGIPAAMAALETAVRLADQDESALGRRGIGVPARNARGDPFVIHVFPMRRGEIRPGLSQSAVAALFVAPALRPQQVPADALALLYDLTPAETRVLMLITAGRKQAQIAGELGVSQSTVKTHLLHVFQKTGCGRQTELVRLVASLSAPL